MQTIYTFSKACSLAVDEIKTVLEKAQCRVTASFGLRSALTSRFPCSCEQHGTAVCQCDLVILLIYPPQVEHPLSLRVHGNGQETWASVEYPQRANLLPHWAALERQMSTIATATIRQKETF